MPHYALDLTVFLVYLTAVTTVGFVASRREKVSDDYFLAGRKLTWWLIGGSMIAANISTQHFIGMSGQAVRVGLAIASFEWLAAIVLVLYAKFLLPYYLKTRITTMPEFLERRFDHRTRLAYAIICLIGYVVIELAVVLFTGALAVRSIFNVPLPVGLLIFMVAGGYAIYGGFKSVAYTDIVQVTVLISGGLVVTLIGLHRVGGLTPGAQASIAGGLKALVHASPEKFHMIRAWNDPDVPWVGVFFGGLWLANIFYWGCNQFITQGSLAARNVWHGQMGAVFAGYLKLLVPVLVVLPGIIAFTLYNPVNGLAKSTYILDPQKADLAFPSLVNQLLPPGCRGLVLAGLVGCVMSHIASMLSATSTIITFDIYKRYLRPQASNHQLIFFGRVATTAVLIIATIIGFGLQHLTSIFHYIQEFWSVAYPSVCAVFLAGFFYPRASPRGSLAAIVIGPTLTAIYTALGKNHIVPEIPFLNRAMFDFAFTCILIFVLRNRGEIPAKARIDRSFSPEAAEFIQTIPWWMSFNLWASLLVAIVIALYIRFY